MNSDKLLSYIDQQLQKHEWYDFIARVLKYRALPQGLSNKFETADQYLIYLNDLLSEHRPDLMEEYYDRMLEYYFSLRIIPSNYQSISILHNVFSTAKPTSALTEKLQRYLTEERLLHHHYDRLDLHVSLLAVLNDLESINKEIIQVYLNQKVNSGAILPISFYRVALRFFIKNSNSNNYFTFLEKVIPHGKSIRQLGEVIVRSLIEYSFILRSFLEIQKWVYERWDELSEAYPDEMSFVEQRLDALLNYEDPAFRTDATAKLVKIFFNRDSLIPAVVFKDILEQTHSLDEAGKSLQRIIQYQKKNRVITKRRFYTRVSDFLRLEFDQDGLLNYLATRYAIRDQAHIKSVLVTKKQLDALFRIFEPERAGAFSKDEHEECKAGDLVNSDYMIGN